MSDDIETDIRHLEPSYTHTLPRDAHREGIDEGNTLHLASLSATVSVRWRTSSGERQTVVLDVEWSVDQEASRVTPTSVDPSDDAIGIQQLLAGLERADQAAYRWVRDHSDSLSVVSINGLWNDVSDDTPGVSINDDLEVRER